MKLSTALLLAILLLTLLVLGPSSTAEDPTSAVALSGDGVDGSGDEEALDTFVPSEKLPADSAISFPVDI